MTSSADLTPLRIIAFPGAPNLPVFAAIEQGWFAEEGIAVDLTTTPSSVFQFEKLNAGEFDIAMTAFDNVVAYREGQGAFQPQGHQAGARCAGDRLCLHPLRDAGKGRVAD